MQRVVLGTGLILLAAVGYLWAQGGGERGRRPEMGPPRHDRPPGGEWDGPRDRPPGPPPHAGGFGGHHGPPGMPPGPPPPQPLELVLDTDDDGLISAKELENAAAALKKLDRNNDGQLSEREYRGHRPPGHPGPGSPPPRRPGPAATTSESPSESDETKVSVAID